MKTLILFLLVFCMSCTVTKRRLTQDDIIDKYNPKEVKKKEIFIKTIGTGIIIIIIVFETNEITKI